MLKIFVLVICCLALLIYFRQIKPEFSYLLRLCVIALVFGFLISGISVLSENLSYRFSQFASLSEYVKICLKILGISLATQTVSDICKDCGESALSTLTETVGRIAVIILVFPIAEKLLELSVGMLR